MKSLFLSTLLFGTFISFSTQAAPEVRVYGRLFNPNHCTYFSQIEGEFVFETMPTTPLGHLEATLDLKQSFGREAPGSWSPVETPMIFRSFPAANQGVVYRSEFQTIVNSRGSFAYEALRFKVRINDVIYPEAPELYYTVKFQELLRIGCNPDSDPFSELPVSIE